MRSICAILIVLSYLNFIQAQENLRKEISKIITFDSDISYELTPGFVVGVIDEDSTYFVSFGRSLDEGKKEISNDDIFEIGSISKTITAHLIFELEREGLIGLNDKVNRFLPFEFQNPRMKNLTVSDLLNHQVSLSKRPAHFGEHEDVAQNPYVHYTKQQLLEYYAYYVPNNKKNDFNYTHTAYALLEVIAEKVTKMTFHDALNNFVFHPYKMNNSFVEFTEAKKGIITKGIDLGGVEANIWTFPSFAGSEGIRTSAYDLSLFLRSTLDNNNLLNDKIFTKEIPTFNDRLFYSNGWHLMKINKKIKAYMSSGNTSGHSSFIGMVPGTRTGVVVLSNSSFGTKDLGLLILRMINYNWKRKSNKNG